LSSLKNRFIIHWFFNCHFKKPWWRNTISKIFV